MAHENIHDRAVGRWRAILPALGISAQHLTGKHGPCPCCGGKDRFRFDDKSGKGTYYCNACGPGTGVDLVMKVNKVEFAEAKRMIEAHLPNAPIIMPKKDRDLDQDRVMQLWRGAVPLNGYDAASLYLKRRGLSMSIWPGELRIHGRARYVHDDKTVSYHPAMVARFVSSDRQQSTVHATYLDESGRKANLPVVRKLAPGRVPQGGAVRLAPSAETMGIAEGIETALSAMQIHDVPVWAALNAGALMKWEPPPTAKSILIFGDNDANRCGQMAAECLAYRLIRAGYHVDVCIPPERDTDWNDLVAVDRDLARAHFMEAAE